MTWEQNEGNIANFEDLNLQFHFNEFFRISTELVVICIHVNVVQILVTN